MASFTDVRAYQAYEEVKHSVDEGRLEFHSRCVADKLCDPGQVPEPPATPTCIPSWVDGGNTGYSGGKVRSHIQGSAICAMPAQRRGRRVSARSLRGAAVC